MSRVLAPVLTAVAVLWTVMILAAPRALQTDTVGPAAAQVYAGAARLCHQRAERSFHMAGIQMPVCARCAGLYVSGALGALLGWGARRRPSASTSRIALLAAGAPTAITWTAEVLGLLSTSNTVRAFAALPLGAVAGWVFVQMLRYDAHLDARQDHHSRPRPHGV